MEDLKFDFTSKKGLINSQEVLGLFVSSHIGIKYATSTVDIEYMFKGLINLTKGFIDRVFDIFDKTKRLEKQMELAIKTIEIARAGGAKSIEITLNSKNGASIELYVKKIDGKIAGKVENDNTMTFKIQF